MGDLAFGLLQMVAARRDPARTPSSATAGCRRKRRSFRSRCAAVGICCSTALELPRGQRSHYVGRHDSRHGANHRAPRAGAGAGRTSMRPRWNSTSTRSNERSRRGRGRFWWPTCSAAGWTWGRSLSWPGGTTCSWSKMCAGVCRPASMPGIRNRIARCSASARSKRRRRSAARWCAFAMLRLRRGWSSCSGVSRAKSLGVFAATGSSTRLLRC